MFALVATTAFAVPRVARGSTMPQPLVTAPADIRFEPGEEILLVAQPDLEDQIRGASGARRLM